MADFGYDVSDYCDIDPRFGTLADFDRLLADAHERGLRILLDLVPNHSSSEHPWFRESRASRTSAKRDWYGATPSKEAAEQLVAGRRSGLDARRRDRPVLPALLLARAARPELAQQGRGARDARRGALLVRARRGRLPHRRGPPHREGSEAAGQPGARPGPGLRRPAPSSRREPQ
jgi:hypothetical protein